MTFQEVESQTPNGFHDAIIDRLSVDYQAGTVLLSMRLWVGTMGLPDQEDYSQAELRVKRLLFCAIEPPDPSYPFVPDGTGISASADSEPGDSADIVRLTRTLPDDASFCRFFVDDWNAFIYLAGSEIELRWTEPNLKLRDIG